MTQSAPVHRAVSIKPEQATSGGNRRQAMWTDRVTARIGAITALAGALCAIAGASLWIASGTDIDRSLVQGEMATYLTQVEENSQLLVANLVLWIFMVLFLGAAAVAMTSLSEQRPLPARLARYSYGVGVPLVTAAFVAWLALVIHIAPDTSASAVLLAQVVGWFASTADWIATILIVGIGPTLIALAGRGAWVPLWLVRWSMLTAIAGLLTAIALFTGGGGLTTYGFLTVPVGVLWMIAASIVLFRYRGLDIEMTT